MLKVYPYLFLYLLAIFGLILLEQAIRKSRYLVTCTEQTERDIADYICMQYLITFRVCMLFRTENSCMKVTKILAKNKFIQPNKVEETLPFEIAF